MANEPVNDVAAFRAKLLSQKAAIDEMLAALDRYAAAGVAVVVPPTEQTVDPADIPDDAFFGMSIGEAAKKYLSMVKKKQSIREIADALDSGGLPHASGDFAGTVATMLRRHANKDPELVRVGRGDWGLSAWYGNRRPAKQQATVSKPSPKKAKRARTSRKVSASMSTKDMAASVIRERGEPMHIQDLMGAIKEKFGRSVLKDTLAGDLSGASRGTSLFALLRVFMDYPTPGKWRDH